MEVDVEELGGEVPTVVSNFVISCFQVLVESCTCRKSLIFNMMMIVRINTCLIAATDCRQQLRLRRLGWDLRQHLERFRDLDLAWNVIDRVGEASLSRHQ